MIRWKDKESCRRAARNFGEARIAGLQLTRAHRTRVLASTRRTLADTINGSTAT